MNLITLNPLHRVVTLSALACAALASAASIEGDSSNDLHAVLEQRRTQFAEAAARADATQVADLFTADARLVLPGFDPIIGRDAIHKAWQFAFSSGAVVRVAFESSDLDGVGGERLVETGTLVRFDKEGKSSQDNYLLVWKREDGAWKIHRDVANAKAASAPVADRVGFPRDYRTQLRLLAAPAFNAKLGMVQTAYGNEPAASAMSSATLPYPYGSVLVMEFASVIKDEGGNPLLEPNGNAQRGAITRIDVMRREHGFGEAYGKNRAGEWEFVSYRADGSHAVPPTRSASCAECHVNKAGAANDFVFPLSMPVKTAPAISSTK
jgi:uncharacterized protein (TIGR02246 family)